MLVRGPNYGPNFTYIKEHTLETLLVYLLK